VGRYAVQVQYSSNVIEGVTQHGVRLALAQEDAANLQRGDAIAIHDDIPPEMLMTSGLELESQQ